jgi:hypothetical protein
MSDSPAPAVLPVLIQLSKLDVQIASFSAQKKKLEKFLTKELVAL